MSRFKMPPVLTGSRCIICEASEETESESQDNESIETRLSRLADYDFFVGGLKAEGPFKAYSIRTQKQLTDLLADEEFSSASCLQVCSLSLVGGDLADLISLWSCLCRMFLCLIRV